MEEKRDESVEELAEALEARLARKEETEELEEIVLEDIPEEWPPEEDGFEDFWEDDPSEEDFGSRFGQEEAERESRGSCLGQEEAEKGSHGSCFGQESAEKGSHRSRSGKKIAGKEDRRSRSGKKGEEKDFRGNSSDRENSKKDSHEARSDKRNSERKFHDRYRETEISEDEFPEDDWEDEEIAPMKPWMMTAVLAGLMLLAAIICAILWNFTHLKEKNGDGNLQLSASSSAEDSASGIAGTDGASGTEPDNVTAATPEPASGETTPQDAVPTESFAPTPAAPQTTAQPGAQASTSVQEPVSGTEAMEFAQSNADVTPKDVINLRSEPNTLNADNIVAQVGNGEILTRTGVNESTGWTRVEYNGETLYAVTQYLTTDLTYKPPVQTTDPNRVSTVDGRIILFTDCNDNITPKEYVNLRTEPSTSQGESTVRCQVSNGEVVHRTGCSPDAGWSRVEYNGEILYVVSSYMYTVE